MEEGIKKAVLEKALKLSYWKVELMHMFRLWQLMTGLWNRVTWLCLGKKIGISYKNIYEKGNGTDKMKERLDVLLVKRGLAPSREKAKAIIMSGIVFVDNEREDKAGTTFDEKVNIEVRGKTLKYVSRGGLKLEKAMDVFGVKIEGKTCMDVGDFNRWFY